MLWRLPPWLLPVGMVGLNVVVFSVSLMCEGRVKVNCVRFGLLYLGTIPSARQGNMDPFFSVFTMTA